jgi:hypothetical protein
LIVPNLGMILLKLGSFLERFQFGFFKSGFY